MKQRIIVQAIIKNQNKILLLRRSQGGPDILGKYELPGGKLEDREQPDDAIRRHIQKDLGLSASKIILTDALSIRNRDNIGIHTIFLVYSATDIEGIDSSISLGASYDKYLWFDVESKSREVVLRDSTEQLLYLLDGQVENKQNNEDRAYSKRQPIGSTVIYSDGGSRGNPGPSAAAFVIIGDDQRVIDDGGEYLGITTNNQAEYQGVLLGLERALNIGIRKVEFRIDSMLVVNQLKGIYTIKNRELWPINERIKEIIKKFEFVSFNHVPRELNKLADAAVNKILDDHKADD